MTMGEEEAVNGPVRWLVVVPAGGWQLLKSQGSSSTGREQNSNSQASHAATGKEKKRNGIFLTFVSKKKMIKDILDCMGWIKKSM